MTAVDRSPPPSSGSAPAASSAARRGVLLFVLPLVLLGLAVLVRALVGEDAAAASDTLYGLGLTVDRAAGRAARHHRRCWPPRSTTARSPTCWPSRSRGTRSWSASCSSRSACVAGVRASLPMLVAGLILLTDEPEARPRLRARLAGRRRGVLRAVRVAVGADPPRRGDRAASTCWSGRACSAACSTASAGSASPAGPARSPRRSPTTSTWSTTSARCTPSWRPLVVIVRRHLAHRPAAARLQPHRRRVALSALAGIVPDVWAPFGSNQGPERQGVSERWRLGRGDPRAQVRLVLVVEPAGFDAVERDLAPSPASPTRRPRRPRRTPLRGRGRGTRGRRCSRWRAARRRASAGRRGPRGDRRRWR